MITVSSARKAAMSLPEVDEKSHFDLPDFRVKNKIFATLQLEKNYMMIKLSAVDQSVFCSFDKEIIFPVPGGWGKKGATFFNLKKVKNKMLMDALLCAWKNTAPSKLVQQHFNNE